MKSLTPVRPHLLTNMVIRHVIGHETILKKLNVNAFFHFRVSRWNVMRGQIASSV
jgi:hypothetical protein